MYAFERKARFYKKGHARSVDRLVVISAIVDEWAQQAARSLGIEVYSHAEDVNPQLRR
jgi:hypothetical protein